MKQAGTLVRRSWRPDPAQEKLLRAVLRPPEEAVVYWQSWREMVALDDIDPASLRLLPLLYRKLKNAGVAAEKLSRYRSVYQHYWYRNNLLLDRLGGVLKAFAQAGLDPPLLLKGVPLVLNYYESPALRPMSDVDLLVRSADLKRFHTVLKKCGWQPLHSLPEASSGIRFLVSRECHFQNREGFEIDLHWNLFQESHYDDKTLEALFQRARPIEVKGQPALVPDPGDLLYHVVVNALQAEAHANLYWVIDTERILRHDAARIDWARLISTAIDDNMGLRLKKACHRLDDLGLREIIPPAPRRIIMNLESGLWEKAEFLFIDHPSTLLGDLPRVFFMAFRYSRRFPSPRLRLTAVRDYFLCRWQLDHLYQVPGDFLRRFWKRLRIALNKY